jgi:hypothetical protein
MTPKFNTVYQNIKTGKYVRTFSEEMHHQYRKGRVGFNGIDMETGKHVGPMLGSSYENFMSKYREVGA